MSYQHILVPTDGSPRTKLAISRAIELAKAVGGDVTGIHVIDQASFMGYPGGVEWQTLADALRSDGERALRELEEEARKNDVPVTTRLIEGHPAQCIIEAGRDADLIVMGTLGRTGVAHLLLGSVAERVIRHASCPVLVVRLSEKKARAGR